MGVSTPTYDRGFALSPREHDISCFLDYRAHQNISHTHKILSRRIQSVGKSSGMYVEQDKHTYIDVSSKMAPCVVVCWYFSQRLQDMVMCSLQIPVSEVAF